MSKILTAMSGGVDSSVTALLLLREGYAVGGATMHLFAPTDIGVSEPCISDNSGDAAQVCQRLGIDHHIFDFSKEFRTHVIDRFAQVYYQGDTPNPCLYCNQHLKFGRFLEEATRLGYDRIATGHYARIEYDETIGRYLLKKAVDQSKDQTYVLYGMTQYELAHTLFPLGSMCKPDIRKIAEENGFVSANKPDSQDICFVPSGDYAAFLENVIHVTLPCGRFVREDNMAVVGTHKGFHRYTIGQRKGLGIAAEKPLYVIQKRRSDNSIVLGDNASLYRDSLYAENCNWIAFENLTAPVRVTAKTRYKQTESPATVYPCENGIAYVKFDSPQRAITPGQAVVFYQDDTVVGGGIIKSEE